MTIPPVLVLSFTGCVGKADLAQVVEAWKKLPNVTKQALIAIVDAAKPGKWAGRAMAITQSRATEKDHVGYRGQGKTRAASLLEWLSSVVGCPLFQKHLMDS